MKKEDESKIRRLEKRTATDEVNNKAGRFRISPTNRAAYRPATAVFTTHKMGKNMDVLECSSKTSGFQAVNPCETAAFRMGKIFFEFPPCFSAFFAT